MRGARTLMRERDCSNVGGAAVEAATCRANTKAAARQAGRIPGLLRAGPWSARSEAPPPGLGLGRLGLDEVEEARQRGELPRRRRIQLRREDGGRGVPGQEREELEVGGSELRLLDEE